MKRNKTFSTMETKASSPRHADLMNEYEQVLFFNKLDNQYKPKGLDKLYTKINEQNLDVESIQNEITKMGQENEHTKIKKVEVKSTPRNPNVQLHKDQREKQNEKHQQLNRNIKYKTKQYEYQPYQQDDQIHNFKMHDGQKFSKSLGNNIGSNEWNKQQDKKAKMADQADQVKMVNKARLSPRKKPVYHSNNDSYSKLNNIIDPNNPTGQQDQRTQDQRQQDQRNQQFQEDYETEDTRQQEDQRRNERHRQQEQGIQGEPNERQPQNPNIPLMSDNDINGKLSMIRAHEQKMKEGVLQDQENDQEFKDEEKRHNKQINKYIGGIY